MNWQSGILKNLAWPDTIANQEAKQKVAEKIAGKVKDGDVLGVGSGSTSYLALIAIAEKIKAEGLNIKAIPTSFEISMACTNLGVPLTSIFEHRPDWSFDGADEVDPDHNLIKGRGGEMFKEKLSMIVSPLNYIIVDETKLVKKLGTNFPIPVEVFPLALLHVEEKLKALGADSLSLRLAKGKDGPVITESGNLIVDARFYEIDNNLEFKIKSITGVIESGLFIKYNVEVLIA
jgi:ribose 5-phosphate isomerase A